MLEERQRARDDKRGGQTADKETKSSLEVAWECRESCEKDTGVPQITEWYKLGILRHKSAPFL